MFNSEPITVSRKLGHANRLSSSEPIIVAGGPDSFYLDNKTENGGGLHYKSKMLLMGEGRHVRVVTHGCPITPIQEVSK